MFVTRALTVLIALPLFVAALLFLPNRIWGLVLLPVLFLGGLEWGTLAGYSTTARRLFAGFCVLSALGLLFFGATLELPLYVASALFWVFVAPWWIHGHWRISDARVLALVGWIALVPMWLALTRLQATPASLLIVLGVIWIADTAAYLAGRQWGRHKLAPQVSPGKSWEGVAGAAFAVALYYAILWFIVRPWHGPFAVAAALLFAALLALSIVGDLFESWLKRQAGVKDSGQLLPGHGGILDRVDGLTSTLPVAALVLHFM